MLEVDLNSNARVENRLNQIVAEIKRLQESLDFNQVKFADITQRAFAEGNIIKVTGRGEYNKTTWYSIKNVYIYTKLFFDNGAMCFYDGVKNQYRIEIDNIESISIEKGD